MKYNSIKDIVNQKNKKEGIVEYEILKPEETVSKILSTKVLVIDPSEKTLSKKFFGDTMGFVLGGQATLTIHQLKGDYHYVLGSDWMFWIPPMTPFTIKNVGFAPLYIIEFSSKLSEDEDISNILLQKIAIVKNRFDCRIDDWVFSTQHVFFTPIPEMKKIYFGGYHTIYPSGYVPRHQPIFENEEVMFVTRGSGKISSGDNYYDVMPGSIVYIPPKTLHNMHNTSDNERLEVLVYEART